MFRQAINQTALTSDAANSYFEHIRGDSYNGDVTFLSTLRALIAPRMADGESLYLRFDQSNYSENTIRENQPKRLITSLTHNFDINQRGIIYIHSVQSGRQEDNTACLDVVKSNFARVYSGWHRLPRVSDLFRSQFYTLCFVNPELKSVAVFVDSLSQSKMHYLQCAILGFFPWYFSPEKGVTQDEMDLINTLRAKEPNDYSACIAKLAERYDFRTARLRQQLAGFETIYERQQCENVRYNITECDNKINRYNQSISEQLAYRRDYEIQLLGLEAKIAAGGEESEIMEYFIHNKKLELDYVDNSEMVFIIKDYISYFDEDNAKRVIDNPNSFVYMPEGRACNNYIPADKIKELMYAIFVDQTIRIRVCAAYKFALTGNVTALSNYRFGAEYASYMPNPHIQHYSCMGNYSRPINEALQRHDYISALEQTTASAKSLNFTDSVVMAKFMREVYGLGDGENTRARRKWFELPDGTCVTSAQAADWVWAQNHPDGQGETTNE